MASSSKDILSLVPSGKKAPKVAAEKIDERILRLLGIEAFEVEMDYDTYKDALREFMAKGRASKTAIPGEETERVTNEWKRVKSKKGRFKNKVKKIKAENIKSGGGVGAKTTTVSAQKLLPGTADKKNPLQGIKDSVDNIAKHFKEKNKFDKKQSEEEQKTAKRSRREKLLGGLKKGASVIVKSATKVLAPIKNVFQTILEFFIKLFLARALIKVLGWFSDPANKKKVDAIFRFLGDHWPKLLALYLRFGTGLGRFIGWLGGRLAKGAVMLTAAALKMIAAKGGGKAAKLAGALGGTKGKLLAAGLSTAITVGTTMAASSAIDKNFNQGSQKFAGGGLARLPAFAGGGMFGGLGKLMGGLGGAGLGAMFGPLGMLLGGAFGAMGGFVSGEEGPDKVPAMLTAGEFVMSKGAVDKYGVAQLEAMNAAGGGTNKPKMKSGTTFAVGGGLLGPMPQTQRKDSEIALGNPDAKKDQLPKVSSTVKIKRETPSSKDGSGGGLAQWMHGNRKSDKSILSGGQLDIPGHGTETTAHDHFGFSSRSAAVGAFKALQKAGFSPYEFEGFTPVRGHSLTGGHFGPMGDAGAKARGKTDDGTAFDVPWSKAPYAGSGPIGDVDYAASNKAAKIVSGFAGAANIDPSSASTTGGGGTTSTSGTSGTTPQKPGFSHDKIKSILEFDLGISGAGTKKHPRPKAPKGDKLFDTLSGAFKNLSDVGEKLGARSSFTGKHLDSYNSVLSGDQSLSKKDAPGTPPVSEVNLRSRFTKSKGTASAPFVPPALGDSSGVPQFSASSGSIEKRRLATKLQIA